MLVGREPESAQLAELVEQARHGSARSLVVHGEPGVGKTALLEELLGNVGDALTLRTQGLEAEAPLAFAALHRLLLPVMRLREILPGPQSRALRVAFGEEEGPAVEPFMVAVATLSMLTAAAEERLVLCMVDDAHWLDSGTADALLFAARRLGADRVLMVFSARDGVPTPFSPAGIQDLTLAGLDPSAARALLDERGDLSRSEEVTQRLIAETGGNPLALLELPTKLSRAELEGSSPLPAQLHLTTRVEQSFVDRCRRLPPAVQSVMLLVSADDSADLAMVRRAAAHLGAGDKELDEARTSGLLVLDETTVRVRHPLVRSAIYQAAATVERRRVHSALAAALDGVGDQDRAAWHRSGAAEGPDEELVAALELSGSRAERRGGYGAALAAFQRASTLTSHEPRRAEVTFAAARNAWASGQTGLSRTLLSAAQAAATDPVLRSDIARLRGRIEVNIGSAKDAHRIFIEAAEAVRAVDPLRALEMSVAAATLRAYGADSGAALSRDELLTAQVGDDSPRTLCLKQLLPAMTQAADKNWAAAIVSLQVALDAGDPVDDLDLLGNLGNAALQLGHDSGAQRFYELMLSRARERGALMAVVYALQRLCFGHLVRGDLAAVRGAAEEARGLGLSMNQPALTAGPLAWLTLLAAVQVRDDYDTLLGELDDVVATQPLGILTDPVHDLTRWAKGTRAAATGDTFGAAHHLGRFRLPVLARMAAMERVDAAVRAGENGLARAWVEDLAGYAGATGWPWALATVAYGKAMTADAGSEEEQFQLALSWHARSGRPYDEARTHLAYGEWLRRSQRRVDARRHLRQALEVFRDLRAETLVSRAAQELRASGETARKRDPSTLVKLTPMELKVAQLVSSGLSNKDVAAQCWVSPRTVAFHLRNVFAKAGVTSRGELARLDLG
ncbi:putative ATPase [Kribbella orskensis]|uniref:ATPase n=1 Tax=Kribbella orskensis TaxID=2512216 RepID=A0ABY2BP62_9ACTN|nr:MULTISPECIES: helix-turn-helix transcriptional regulator [Kribbella]TCN42134.1 putative ATPase [Kribbella sp. VKM Ac-2500]TCO26012.1 putative ATPase [Kribbella orskensis]